MKYIKQNRAYFALGTAIIVLAMSPLFVRWAGVPGPVISFYRLSITALVLTPAVIIRHRKNKAYLWPVILFPILGGVFKALDLTIWSTALTYTSTANATLLNYIAPVWVAIISWSLLKERLKRLFWFGLVLTISGSIFVLGSDYILQPNFGYGNLLAILSSFFFAGYFLITQRGRRNLDTITYVWIACLIGSFVTLGINLGYHYPLGGYSNNTYYIIIFSALISQVGGYLAVGYSLGHLPASVVSPTLISQPVLTAILAYLTLGEGLHFTQAIGGLVVLGGILLVHMGKEPSTNQGININGNIEPLLKTTSK